MVIAKKSLGQNFLMHAQTAERIVAAAQLPKGATVLEIGPGTGMLTKALLQAGAVVVAVEADDELAPRLTEDFAHEIAAGQLHVEHADIREFDVAKLPSTYHIVANIPYYITGEIMRQFLSAPHKPSSMTLLVQKEVAERIARNGGKGSVLSVSVEVFGAPEYCFTIPRGAFRPAPSVDSAVLAIRSIRSPFAKHDEEMWFFEVVRAGFAHKRKKLSKNLSDIAPQADIEAAFSELSLSETVRPEELPTSTWVALAQMLKRIS